MKIKKSIKFGVEKRKGIDENLRIRMRTTYNGNRINIPLSCRISLDKWHSETESALPKYEDKFGNTSKDINREIDKHRSAMEKAFAQFEFIEQRVPTTDELKQTFNKLAGKSSDSVEEKEPELQKIGAVFLNENRLLWSDSTCKKVKTILKHLKAFDSTATFSDISTSFLKRFVTFLLDKKNLQNTTIQKNIRILKWFLNWSTDNGYNTNTEYQRFDPKLKVAKKKVIFLTWIELMHLYNLKISEKQSHLDKVRDVFCFCCFTSLRYSDVYHLKRSDITNTSIEIVTIKTHDTLSIDLNDYSQSILDKYKDISFPQNKALPVISNQKMNDYLKDLGKLAGIDSPETITYYKGNERIENVMPKYELLTTHCGRRTFICNALALGIPTHVVMKWTGHSDYKAMEPYIDVSNDTSNNEMNKFNK